MSSRSAERIGGPRGRARAPPRIGKWRRKGQQRMALGQTERARRETREPMAKYCLSCVCVSRGAIRPEDVQPVAARAYLDVETLADQQPAVVDHLDAPDRVA